MAGFWREGYSYLNATSGSTRVERHGARADCNCGKHNCDDRERQRVRRLYVPEQVSDESCHHERCGRSAEFAFAPADELSSEDGAQDLLGLLHCLVTQRCFPGRMR